jgi:hypothetical protein
MCKQHWQSQMASNYEHTFMAMHLLMFWKSNYQTIMIMTIQYYTFDN